MPVHQSVTSAHGTDSHAPTAIWPGTNSPNTQPSPSTPAGR